MPKFFNGLYTALVTPFDAGEINYLHLARLIALQEAAGVSGIIVGGSTGEGATLTDQEYGLLINYARKLIPSEIQLIVGVAANLPVDAVRKCKIAEDMGADALMCVTPYYNKPPQRGIFDFFEVIYRNTNVPIMIYVVPSRTGVDLEDQTLIHLSRFERIKGFKDSGNDIERALRLVSKLPADFSLLSGEDRSSIAYSAHGGSGCVSVASNVIPKLCVQIQKYLQQNNFAAALEIQSKLMPFYNALFVETNPIPIKYAASLLGLCEEKVRAPLVIMKDESLKQQLKIELMNVTRQPKI
ncbi:MAG: 4-hydroxy-tetrahydrodipicolinate synthase [Alphaproteobacteria bacterium]|nr:4-hydroxy-tetrahydrodipicolinate synthase [Alphaproteobacteria bacterium]